MAITIRDETPIDRDVVRVVVTAAFGRVAEADLVDQLRRDGDCVFSLVAVDDGVVVGQVLFSSMAAPFRALGLAPVSVIPPRQRLGIGSSLILRGLERAAREGWEGVFVFGDPGFYERFGFNADLARGFASPYAGPHLMLKVFGGAPPVAAGAIEYAPAFKSLD